MAKNKLSIAISPAHFGITRKDNPVDSKIVSEREVNLAVATFLSEALLQSDVCVFLMGYGDYKNRVAFANTKKVDLYLSIHTDGLIVNKSYISYRKGDEKSYSIASKIAERLRYREYFLSPTLKEIAVPKLNGDTIKNASVPALVIMPFSLLSHYKQWRENKISITSAWLEAILYALEKK